MESYLYQLGIKVVETEIKALQKMKDVISDGFNRGCNIIFNC